MQRGEPMNPYQAPAAATDAKRTTGRTLGRFALATMLLAIVLFGAALGVSTSGETNRLASAIFGLASLLGIVASIASVVAVVVQHRAAALVSPGWAVLFGLTTLGGGAMAFVGALAALFASADFTRGRQLRSFGRVLLPKLRPRRAWTLVTLEPEIVPAGEDERRALAAQWRENGRTEHASVAAFARLTLDLMALGAPPELLHAAQRDADDEIAHAELCFSLARALDGEETSPAPFPEAQKVRTSSSSRKVALATLAVDSLLDGALHEGVSARIIARLAKRCDDPAIRSVLKTLAADEGRHAAHGWDVVRYCLDEGGEDVARALEGALHVLPMTMRSPLPEAAAGGAWERYGIHGHALEEEEYAATRADLVRRVGLLTSGSRSH